MKYLLCLLLTALAISCSWSFTVNHPPSTTVEKVLLRILSEVRASRGNCPGVCQPSSMSCSSGYEKGLCPGGSDIQCCPQSTPSCTGAAQCQINSLPCNGTYATGKCPGGNDIQCCEYSGSGGGGGGSSNAPYNNTVAEAIVDQGCSTEVCAQLSAQLVAQTNCIVPDLFENLNSLTDLSMGSACAAVPYLQTPAAEHLQTAIDSMGSVMSINSALRTDVQQLMLYAWYLDGLCGITAAAKPGQSSHNSGLAVDVNDDSYWFSALEKNGWSWQGPSDPVHFNYVGPGGEDIGTQSVEAFQELWNFNTPQYQLSVDGIIGPNTIEAMLASPINGFPKNATCLYN